MTNNDNQHKNESNTVNTKKESKVEVTCTPNEKAANTANRFKDYRGIICPMNFVKIKLDLASMKSGEILKVLLDDGVPAENVPASVAQQGNIVLNREKIEDHWVLLIQKI